MPGKNSNKKVMVLGDSHARIFRRCPLVNCIVRIAGATAYGLINTKSESNAHNVFLTALKSKSPSFTAFVIGEVDCNAMVFRKKCQTPKETLERSVYNYCSFLQTIRRYSRPIVCSVHLPPVEDYASNDYTDNERAPRSYVNASKAERTHLVLYFNEMMKILCKELKIDFLDYTSDIIGKDSLLDMGYSLGPGNSHLDPKKIGPIVCQKLKRITNT